MAHYDDAIMMGMMGVWDSVKSLPVLKFLAGRVLDNKKAEGSAGLGKDALTEMGLSEDDLSNITTDNASHPVRLERGWPHR